MMKRILSCMGILLALAVALSGCGGSASYESAAADSDRGAAAAEAESVYWEDWYEEGYEDFLEGEGASLPLLTPSNSRGIKMIYNVNMQLETTTFEEGTRSLLGTVEAMGGYVQSTYVEGRSLRSEYLERYARYTLRIPSENLAAFLLTMETEYNLLRLEQESQTITGQYNETTSRLEDLMAQQERLLAALEEELDTDERLMLERELSRVQESISSLGASSGRMDDAVLYSTVSIQLYEVILDWETPEEPATPFGQRLGDTAGRSWAGFVAFCQGALLFVIALLPLLIILSVIAAVVLVTRQQLKKRMARLSKPQDNKEPSDNDDSMR